MRRVIALIPLTLTLTVFAACVDSVSDEQAEPESSPASSSAGMSSPTQEPTPDADESTAGCSRGADQDFEPHLPFDELAWSSEHVVVGVVNEELDPNQDRENDEDGDEPCREVMRDFLIQLEEQFHGEPAETLRIRAPYVPVDDQIAPELEEGDRYLFFLFKAPEDAGLPGAWGFDHQRAKEVSPYGEVIGGRQFETGVAGLDEIEQLIDESLSGERPDDDELPRSLWGWTEDAIDRGDQ